METETLRHVETNQFIRQWERQCEAAGFHLERQEAANAIKGRVARTYRVWKAGQYVFQCIVIDYAEHGYALFVECVGATIPDDIAFMSRAAEDYAPRLPLPQAR